MKNNSWYAALFGPVTLLIVSYIIYVIRYPIWHSVTAIEPIFVMLISSYLLVFVVAILLVKHDAEQSLAQIIHNVTLPMILLGSLFGLLYLGLWYSMSVILGCQFELVSSTILRDYSQYTFSSLPLALALYLGFAIVGAFTEEIAYRGYAQTRLSSRYGTTVGILTSTLLFAFQHIHVFQTTWVITFFQTQFVHVFLYGAFGGYLFVKSQSLWSIFSMHALTNAFSVTVPLVVSSTFTYTYLIAETVSFLVLFILLRYLPLARLTTN